ncbi:MAG: amidohydrolase family protein, partial [Candidatus Bipolaricaulia bacterium]
ARRMIDSGMAVALGTDFGFSGHGVESHWVGLSVAVEKLKMGIEEAICASTLNAAAALEVADEVGSIEPGKLADLAILDLDDYRDIAGSIGSNPVRMTIIAGRVVHSS